MDFANSPSVPEVSAVPESAFGWQGAAKQSLFHHIQLSGFRVPKDPADGFLDGRAAIGTGGEGRDQAGGKHQHQVRQIGQVADDACTVVAVEAVRVKSRTHCRLQRGHLGPTGPQSRPGVLESGASPHGACFCVYTGAAVTAGRAGLVSRKAGRCTTLSNQRRRAAWASSAQRPASASQK